jgi:hypothetical protein
MLVLLGWLSCDWCLLALGLEADDIDSDSRRDAKGERSRLMCKVAVQAARLWDTHPLTEVIQ